MRRIYIAIAGFACLAMSSAEAQQQRRAEPGARSPSVIEVRAQAPRQTTVRAPASQVQSVKPPVAQSLARRPAEPVAATRGVLNATPSSAASNDWTVGVAAGQLEGTYIRYAADLARALDDVPNLRVLPLVTYGAASNVEDLLHLRGVDIAITQADTLDLLQRDSRFRDIGSRINYIMPFFMSDLHILARPEIKSIADLNGKTVSANVKGSAANVTGPIVLERLGVKVTIVNMSHAVALEKMKTGEIAALIHTVGKPNEFFVKTKIEPGFHFLPIEFNDTLADYYVPSALTHEDYPTLITKGQVVNTIAVTNVLAAFNWPKDSERGRRVARFVERLFTRFDEFQKPLYQPKWKEVNLAGTVPGWTRLPAAEDLLQRMEQAGMLQRR